VTPLVFISHGAPSVAMETESAYAQALGAFGARVRPRAIAIVSAHWQTRAHQVCVTGAARPDLIYDFGGFPPALYRMKYAAPGAPALAREIVDALAAAHVDGAPRWEVAVDEERGWDHGAWVPMRLMYPEAELPLVEISLPTASPPALLAMGRALAFLRTREVLLVGSGGAVHNLFDVGGTATPPWARAFDAWVGDVMARRDLEALADWPRRAPDAEHAHPTSDHFDPLLVVAGASDAADQLTTLYEGFYYGTLSMRTFALSPA